MNTIELGVKGTASEFRKDMNIQFLKAYFLLFYRKKQMIKIVLTKQGNK